MDILNVSKSIFDPFDGYYKDYPVVVDTLTLSDSFDEFHTHAISQSITFSDSFAIAGTFDRTLTDVLTLNAYTILYSPILWIENLSLSDTFDPHISFETLTDSLTLSQSYNNHGKHTPAFSDVLWLDQLFITQFGQYPSLSDQLFLDDQFDLHGHFHLTLSDHLDFSVDHVNKYYDNSIISIDSWVVYKDSKNCYNPFIYLRSSTGAIVLESPVFGDLQASINEVSIKRTLDGSRYSYVKTTDRKHLKYELNLRCNKYLELLDFIDESNLDWLFLTNWKSELWKVKIVNDDIILKAPSRDMYSIVLEFEGYLLTPGIYKCLE